jgi:serine/threonine-protein kinase
MSERMPLPNADADRNLLFGVLALQAALIDNNQFADVCAAWTKQPQSRLADLLVERGWLKAEEVHEVERLVQRHLGRHAGDARATLGVVASTAVRQMLSTMVCANGELALSGLPPSAGGQRYTRTSLHAQGGIGQVWLARDEDLGREVALKELRPERSDHPAIWTRFLTEARITGQLEHPGIVPVYELCQSTADQPAFYTMRFVRGRTLREACRDYHEKRRSGQVGPLDQRKLLTAFVVLCQAVSYAHARGVIHRDLKGENVVLGDYGEVILLDWGLAKLVDRPGTDGPLPRVALTDLGEATVQGQVMGTPAYMAPEQAAGRVDAIDERTDIYGLGAILFELLTGRPPHQGEGVRELLRQIAEVPTPRARQVEPTVPGALDAVCARAMARERSDRYAQAAELAEDVQRYLADEPVRAWREPWKARARRWVKRHRTAVTGAAAAVGVAAVCLAVATALLGTANRRLEQANSAEHEARARAEDNFRLARDAVDRYLTRVSDDKRLKDAGLAALRRTLLEEAGKFYTRFIEERGDDPSLEAELGKAHLKVVRIEMEVGTAQRALERNLQAQAALRRFAGRHPETPSYRRDLATNQAYLGQLYRQLGKSAEAETALNEASQNLKDLLAGHPDDSDAARLLCSTLNNLGLFYRSLGRCPESEQQLQEGVAVGEALLAREPQKAENPNNLAYLHNSLGLLYRDTGKPTQAVTAFRKALNLKKQLLEQSPKDADYRCDLAGNYSNLALALEDAGENAEAETAYVESAKLFKELAVEHPEVVRYQTDLAMLQNERGRFLQEAGKSAEARAALQEALALHRQLVSRQSNVHALQCELARALGNLGDLDRGLGNMAEAETAFQEALRLLRELVSRHPEVPLYAKDLTHAHAALGYLYRLTDRLGEAEAAYQQALRVATELAGKYPGNPRYRSSRAHQQQSLGIVYQATGRLAQAEEAYRAVLTLRTQLAARFPNVADYQTDVAASHSTLSTLYQAQGKPAEAEAALREALKVYQALTARHPETAEFATGLGGTCCSLGDLMRDAGKPGEALPWYEQADSTLAAVRRKHPDDADARQGLRNVHWGRARALTVLGRPAEADKEWERALALDDGKERSQIRADRALALARRGDHAEATRAAETVVRDGNPSAASLFTLARAYALLSGAAGKDGEQYAARAVDLLTRARAAGWFKKFSNRERLKAETDLASLRARADYQKVLADVQMDHP